MNSKREIISDNFSLNELNKISNLCLSTEEVKKRESGKTRSAIDSKPQKITRIGVRKTRKTKSHDPKREFSFGHNLISNNHENDEDDVDLLFNLAKQQIQNKEVKNITVCSHTDTINENGIELCVDCGEALHSKLLTTQEWRFYGANDNQHSSDPNRCQMRKVQDKGIKKDLEKLGLTTQVIDIADDLYFKVTKGDIKRNNLRKGIIFACVFEAYKKIGTPQIPEHLQKLFNITRKNMSKGINYFRLGMPKDSDDDIRYITAEHFIPKILDKFNIKSDHLQPILNLYHLLESKSSVINRRNPQSISCGLVFYYLKRLNVDIHPSKFGKVVDLSEITITNIVTEIEDILYLS